MPTDIDKPIPERSEEKEDYKTWLCALCGLVYVERDGWPDDGIAPGTRWADVPQDWVCPDCGATKSEFEMVEVTGI